MHVPTNTNDIYKTTPCCNFIFIATSTIFTFVCGIFKNENVNFSSALEVLRYPA
jgi:hypothetical protein